MFKYLALGIIAIAGIMAIPISQDSQDDSKMYGFVTLVLRDAAGLAVFEQIIHNDVVEVGENYMLAQSFSNGTGNFVSEGDTIDALCVTAKSSFVVEESETAADFFSEDNITSRFPCETVAFTITNVNGVNSATTGAIRFNATDTTGNIATGDTIKGIAVCSDKGAA